jgi:selenocysteine lyase/cysteine desulfurase
VLAFLRVAFLFDAFFVAFFLLVFFFAAMVFLSIRCSSGTRVRSPLRNAHQSIVAPPEVQCQEKVALWMILPSPPEGRAVARDRNADSAYLDNASTSHPKPECVGEAMARAVRDLAGSPGRGMGSRAREATHALEMARERIAALLGVARPRRLAFTLSATDAMTTALASLPDAATVVAGPLQHAAVSRTLARASRERGVRVVEAPASPDGMIDPAGLAREARNAACVVVNAASNVTGLMQPLAEIARALASGPPLVIDAAQAAGLMDLPLDELGPRAVIVLAGHKALAGPMGCGALIVGDEVAVRALREGGGQCDDGDAASRLEAGTPPLPAILGLAAAAGWWLDAGPALVRARMAALDERLLRGLRKLPGVRSFASPEGRRRVPVASFLVAGFSPLELEALLDTEFSVTVRAGLHCAEGAHAALGTLPDGTVRASLGPLSTDREVDALLSALATLTRGGH